MAFQELAALAACTSPMDEEALDVCVRLVIFVESREWCS